MLLLHTRSSASIEITEPTMIDSCCRIIGRATNCSCVEAHSNTTVLMYACMSDPSISFVCIYLYLLLGGRITTATRRFNHAVTAILLLPTRKEALPTKFKTAHLLYCVLSCFFFFSYSFHTSCSISQQFKTL